MKDELINKLDSQIHAWNKELQSIKADEENEQASEDLKLEKRQKQEELRTKIDAAKNKISEIKNAGNEKLEQIKEDIASWFSSDSDS